MGGMFFSQIGKLFSDLLMKTLILKLVIDPPQAFERFGLIRK